MQLVQPSRPFVRYVHFVPDYGTGKTLLLIHKATELIKKGEKVLYLVYNKRTSEEILLTRHLREVFRKVLDRLGASQDLIAIEEVRKEEHLLTRMSSTNTGHIMVDEAPQDVDTLINKLDTDGIAKCIWVALHEYCCNTPKFFRIHLKKNFRNQPNIAQVGKEQFSLHEGHSRVITILTKWELMAEAVIEGCLLVADKVSKILWVIDVEMHFGEKTIEILRSHRDVDKAYPGGVHEYPSDFRTKDDNGEGGLDLATLTKKGADDGKCIVVTSTEYVNGFEADAVVTNARSLADQAVKDCTRATTTLARIDFFENLDWARLYQQCVRIKYDSSAPAVRCTEEEIDMLNQVGRAPYQNHDEKMDAFNRTLKDILEKRGIPFKESNFRLQL